MTEKAVFAAGCFWGVEESFRTLPGVVATRVGYTGGNVENPTYEMVCAHGTGHAEALEIEFDPGKTAYRELLDVFFQVHKPTTLNRQGPDIGEQYRSAIFFLDEGQEREARESVERWNSKWDNKIVTQIVKASTFWPAEERHQKYYFKQGGGSCAY